MEWHNKEPIYLQLKELIARQILEGHIAEETLIPSIRQLSVEYQLNPLTVSKAYQLLVDEQIIFKLRGIGMQVAKGARKQLLRQQKKLFMKYEWPQIKEKLKRLDIDLQELINESTD